jgi:RNA 3'-terminal phosphate cyclase (ATP)
MIIIDGSLGEGGGQILRSSLALSMATRTPFRIINIRAGRPKPGLMRQHLTCVLAAAEISTAAVRGATVGSTEVEFVPGHIRAGNYRFVIGTAGGTTLVLQAILPALLRADGPSTVTIEGGTHCKAAPPFEFFDRTLAPLLRQCGAGIAPRLERHGFYPAGGGRIVVEVTPTTTAIPLSLLERGTKLGTRATALVSRIGIAIAQREAAVLCSRLTLSESDVRTHEVMECPGPGNALLVELVHEHVTEVVSCAGEFGRSAEAVANGVANEVRRYLAHAYPVGEHLADQLMVPLAMLAGGIYRTGKLSEHARTNITVLRQFGISIEHDANAEQVVVMPLHA